MKSAAQWADWSAIKGNVINGEAFIQQVQLDAVQSERALLKNTFEHLLIAHPYKQHDKCSTCDLIKQLSEHLS